MLSARLYFWEVTLKSSFLLSCLPRNLYHRQRQMSAGGLIWSLVWFPKPAIYSQIFSAPLSPVVCNRPSRRIRKVAVIYELTLVQPWGGLQTGNVQTPFPRTDCHPHLQNSPYLARYHFPILSYFLPALDGTMLPWGSHHDLEYIRACTFAQLTAVSVSCFYLQKPLTSLCAWSCCISALSPISCRCALDLSSLTHQPHVITDERLVDTQAIC